MSNEVDEDKEDKPLYVLNYRFYVQFVCKGSNYFIIMLSFFAILYWGRMLTVSKVSIVFIYVSFSLIFSILSIFFFKFFIKRRVNDKIHVYEDHFVTDYAGKKDKVYYKDILRVNIYTIPYVLSTYSFDLKNGKKHKSQMLLENDHKLLGVACVANPSILDVSKKKQYCRVSQAQNLSAKRMVDALRLKIVVVKCVLLPLLATAALTFYRKLYPIRIRDIQMLSKAQYALIYVKYMLVVLSIWAVVEVIQDVRQRRRQKSLPDINGELHRDLGFEKTIYTIEWCVIVLSLVILVLLRRP